MEAVEFTFQLLSKIWRKNLLTLFPCASRCITIDFKHIAGVRFSPDSTGGGLIRCAPTPQTTTQRIHLTQPQKPKLQPPNTCSNSLVLTINCQKKNKCYYVSVSMPRPNACMCSTSQKSVTTLFDLAAQFILPAHALDSPSATTVT